MKIPKFLKELQLQGISIEQYQQTQEFLMNKKLSFSYNNKRKEFWASIIPQLLDKSLTTNAPTCLIFKLGFDPAVQYIKNPASLIHEFNQKLKLFNNIKLIQEN